ncbi:MAG TPA: hypothetical protein VJ965_02975 [Anaerolineales bacterium]|nr:hypothetical protein [Anaerolineales bacterium]
MAALYPGIRNRRTGAESNNCPSAAGFIARTWVGESTSTDETDTPWNIFA